MKSLSVLSLDELNLIKNVLENQELQEELERLLVVKQLEPSLISQYQSSRLPEFYEEYQEQCSKLLSELNFMDLSFLLNSAINAAGNNYGGDFYYQEKDRYNIYRSTIQGLDNYFMDHSEAIYYYEGLYNALNYIKTSISIMLNSKENIETKEDLFLDFKEKKYLVTKNLKDISKQLLTLRSKVPNSRLCVGNQSLTRNINKFGENITPRQNGFISSIAFGSTLEKLKDKNYEEAERLLFVPQCKILKK